MTENGGYSGLITRSIGGFFSVLTEHGELECRGRGLFRKDDIELLVGDRVTLEPTEDGNGYITGLLPRRNSLLRPPVANIDMLAIISSCSNPPPNLYVTDKLTAIAEKRGIPVMLIFTKTDLDPPEEYAEIYRSCGYTVCCVSSVTGEGTDEVRSRVAGGLTVFCGNTGAGKSSLLNALYPQLCLPVGEISKKLGRGRHTTRHVELYKDGSGGWIADTPGFSSVDFLLNQRMTANQLADCFPEFREYSGRCLFTGCSHRTEKGCAVLEALKNGEIQPTRHKSYVMLYEELKKVKEWELTKDERTS